MRKRGIGKRLWQNSVDEHICFLLEAKERVIDKHLSQRCGFCEFAFKHKLQDCRTECDANKPCFKYAVMSFPEKHLFVLEWLHSYGVRYGYMKSTEETKP